MKKQLAMAVMTVLAMGVLISAGVAKQPHTTRPEALSIQRFTTHEDFEAASATMAVRTLGADLSGPLMFDPQLNGVVFVKDAGTEICCAIIGRTVQFICASEEANGLNATSWGLGVSPSPRIASCYIDGTATLISSY